MFKHPWIYDSFKANFLSQTSYACDVTCRATWPDRTGWTVLMRSGGYWAITGTVTPHATNHPHAPATSISTIVRWGTAVFRVWRCHEPAITAERFFPRAVTARTTPTGRTLRLV